MDALLVRLKMTVQGEHFVALVTIEQVDFSIMLFVAVLSVVFKPHKTETTSCPDEKEIMRIEETNVTCYSGKGNLCGCRGDSSARLASQRSFHSLRHRRRNS